jgi:hypothetical protein
MSGPGHPYERRRELTAVELGGWVQVVAFNAGVALLAVRAAGSPMRWVGAVGAGLALVAVRSRS